MNAYDFMAKLEGAMKVRGDVPQNYMGLRCIAQCGTCSTTTDRPPSAIWHLPTAQQLDPWTVAHWWGGRKSSRTGRPRGKHRPNWCRNTMIKMVSFAIRACQLFVPLSANLIWVLSYRTGPFAALVNSARN